MAAVSSSQTKPPQASQNMYKQNISEFEIEYNMCRILCTMPVLPVEDLLPIFRSADNMSGTTSLRPDCVTECKCLANIPVWLWRKQKLCFHSTRRNSVCKHRRSSHSNDIVLDFPSNIYLYRHTCYCLSSEKQF